VAVAIGKKTGRSALHAAVKIDETEKGEKRIEELVAAGADINEMEKDDVSGMWVTPLHVAVEIGNSAYIRKLVKLGADIDATKAPKV
jgi:ankyrin repeat protein